MKFTQNWDYFLHPKLFCSKFSSVVNKSASKQKQRLKSVINNFVVGMFEKYSKALFYLIY